MNLWHVALLAFVQGLAELLPVSSSAHVITAEKLLGLDPTRPEMTLLLVSLHTGTMFSVLVYFWKDWRVDYFQSSFKGWVFMLRVALATAATAVTGLALMVLIEKVFLGGGSKAEVEDLFGNFRLIAAALAAAGVVILFAAWRERRSGQNRGLGPWEAVAIGLVQGLCLPFRGFSRSGATISTGLILGMAKAKAEEFSFALALVLTPPVVAREIHRLAKAHAAGAGIPSLASMALPCLLGAALSFAAGLLALKWLSSWLARGRWKYFGFYCLAASLALFAWNSAH